MGTDTVDLKDPIGRILSNAIDTRASDIHFEPGRDELKIRVRIDGILYYVQPPIGFDPEKILSRIKVLSQIDIAERRLPHEGGFEFNYKDRIYNIRTSVIPTNYGEAIVLRILNKENILMELEGLGFEADQLKTIHQLISNKFGLSLLTGPVGSGKTTLLYSILNKINQPTKNIITIEDPIEFQLPNVRQIQINDSVGLTFAKAMRSVLRQDPDVVMLGEIRDSETAEIVAQAALTGVLIFSTFHTLDVPGVVTRFLEMEMPRSVVAQSIKGVILTRLVGKICDSCGGPYQPNDFEKRFLVHPLEEYHFRKGKGCDVCRNSGYLGRTGLFEVVHFDEEVKTYIMERKSFSALRGLLAEKGIKTLQETAIGKAGRGLITLEDALRAS